MGWGWLGGAAAVINPVAAIGTLGSGVGELVGSYMQSSAQKVAQDSANATNIALADKTNAFNAAEAQKNREYQTQMSNSAWQRGVADMRAAGINPMLAASQGGASSPSGSTASGVNARVDAAPDLRGAAIAKGIGGLGASALNVAQVSKDLESKDANIAATKAGALASVAQANNANASARATSAGMPTIEAMAGNARQRAEAERAEYGYRQSKAEIDKQFAPVDAVTNRVVQGIDGVSSAVSIGKIIKQIRNMGREENRQEDRHLRSQGRFGSSNK